MQYLTCLLLFLSTTAMAESRIKIAVIDTGVSNSILLDAYMCKDTRAVDLTGTVLEDRYGHGTMVLSSIARHIDPATHCMVSIKWVDSDDERVSVQEKMNHVTQAVRFAVALGAKFINMSLSGPGLNIGERNAIALALSRGITVAVAAGNDGKDLSKTCDIYPACHRFASPKFIVVADYVEFVKAPKSNYGGPVNAMEDGEESNTSKATAIYLGKLIRGSYEKKCTNTCPAPARRLRR